MNNFIQSIIDEIKRHFSSSKIQTTKKWSYLIPLIVVCLLGIIGEYVLLLPIHYQSQTFIFHFIFLIVIFKMLFKDYYQDLAYFSCKNISKSITIK